MAHYTLTEETEIARRPEPGKGRSLRSLLAGALLALAVAAALAAGGWGVLSSLSAGAPAARIGEAVEVPGGLMLVEGVTPEHMAPMQMGKFASQGMNMAMPTNVMTPEGKRSFTVNVSLAAGEGGGLSYSPDDFRVTGEGMKEVAPLRSKLGSGEIPAGSAASGLLVFQVPEEAKGLELSFDGGRPVALDLPPVRQGEGHHGGRSGERGR